VIARVVAFCARRPLSVLLAALLVALGSYWSQRSLARDAIPDLSDPQIVLVADWMGHPASEVAQHVTEVVTRELHGVPGSTAVRGSSMSGMAYIDVVFDAASGQGRPDRIGHRLGAAVRALAARETASHADG
jgi:Cu(I)/Ag(I) efflux system membrane protein CusA/SilA